MTTLQEFFSDDKVQKVIGESNALWYEKDAAYSKARINDKDYRTVDSLTDWLYSAMELSLATRIKDTAHDYLSRVAENLIEQEGTIEEWVGPIGNAQVYADYPELSVEWINNRKKGIGGSEAGHLLGFNWMTRLNSPDVRFDSKTDMISTYQSSVASKATKATAESNEFDNKFYGLLMRGHHWERVSIADWAQKNNRRVAQSKSTYQGPEDFQHVNIDGLVLTDDGQPDGLIECKTTARKKYWANGVPVSYRTQVLYYLHALQLSWCLVIVRYDDHTFDEFIIRADESVTGHPEALGIEYIIPELTKIWERMKKDIAIYYPGKYIDDSNVSHLRGNGLSFGHVEAELASLMFHIDIPSPASRMVTRMKLDQEVFEFTPPAGYELGWSYGYIPEKAPSALSRPAQLNMVKKLSEYDILVSDNSRDVKHALTLPFAMAGKPAPTVISPEEAALIN